MQWRKDMAYVKQFCVILGFSLIGEGLHAVIPLPIPASIYGIILLFTALMTGLVKLQHVEKTSDFLIEIMPVMFIPAAVGLLESWGIVKASLLPFIVTTVVSTVVVMAASGLVTQLVIRKAGGKKS